jgi:hypothetical protein
MRIPFENPICESLASRRAPAWSVAAALLMLGTFVFVPSATADDTAADEATEDERTGLQVLIDDTLEEFQLQGGPELDEPLVLSSRLRWDNNSRGSASGLTGIYTLHGRAEAVVCVYPWQEKLIHDFGSLSRGKLVGELDGEPFWQPQAGGVKYEPIPDADPPLENRNARLLQMKQLARQRFSAQLVGWRGDDSDRQELRLLARPLYRYEETEGEVVDGAVFAFVMGVDPEVLLLVEAIRAEEGARWEYAFARRTSGELLGRLDETEVWRATRYPNNTDPRGTERGVGRPLPQQEVEASP